MEQEPKTPRKRAEDLLSLFVSDWRPTLRQVLWAIRISVVLGLLLAVGYPYGISLWDWLKLLIVPAVLAVGGYLFIRAEDSRTIKQADHRRAEDVLQAYLDQMRQLLLDKDRPLRQSKANCEARTAARVGTLTTLERIHDYPDKKGIIVKFLWECSLLKKQDAEDAVVTLEGANLKGAKLGGAKLGEAKLTEADLHGADLIGADLTDTDLTNADLTDAKVTKEQLEQAKSLQGATMPNGQKYEEWLKNKGSGEENSGPS